MGTAIPNPRTWSTGDLWTAAIGNAIRDALNFLLSPPRAQVVQGTAQALGTGGWQAGTITSGSVVVNNDTIYTSSTNYFTIQTAGLYEVSAGVSVSGASAVGVGVSWSTGGGVPATNPSGPQMFSPQFAANSTPFEVNLPVGATVALCIYNTTASVTTSAAGTFLRVKRVSS